MLNFKCYALVTSYALGLADSKLHTHTHTLSHKCCQAMQVSDLKMTHKHIDGSARG